MPWLTIAGLVMGLCFAGMALLGDLRQQSVPFLVLYGLAYVAYAVAVWALLRLRSGRGLLCHFVPRNDGASLGMNSGQTGWRLRRYAHGRFSRCAFFAPRNDGASRVLRQPERRRWLVLIIALSVLFRAILLLTSPPALSTDVYRYIWDGRLANAGVNPFAHSVDSPLLDRFHSSQRGLVDHSWMASPYLPAAQAFFAVVYRLAPDSPLAFQVAAAILDLLTGLLVCDLLGRLGLPRARSLIYLWNPLVIVEFAHGAHVDALMIFLMVAAVWVLIAARSGLLSAMVLTAATVTKGLPVLLLPVMVRRWRWGPVALYAGLVVAICVPFALGAGLGLVGPLDGEGLFGALRIYADQWNYNSGVYHWLEVLLSGYHTPGAVPPEAVGRIPILAAKAIVTLTLGLVLLFVWRKGREVPDDLALLRLALVPLAAYLLLATTVHPWYVTLIVPLLPFLPSRPGSASNAGRFLVPGLLFPAVVALSYLTYRDPDNLREFTLIRLLEYIPLYAALIWAAWPASGDAVETGPG